MIKEHNLQEALQLQKSFGKKQVLKQQPQPFILNEKLVSNPFLKDRQQFGFLNYQINLYNQRIRKQQIYDQYQMSSYQRLHSMLSDLAQIQTREDQVHCLVDIHDWFKEQNRLIQQRKDQGNIRYLTKLQLRNGLPQFQKQLSSEQQQKLEIPAYYINHLMKPYRRGNRTIHKEVDLPIRRIADYKRKVINFGTFMDQKQEPKPPKVLYPKPPKYEQPKEEEVDQQAKDQQKALQGGQVPLPEDGQKPPEEQAKPQEPDNGMPAFGEEPEQPQQEQIQEQDDKLAPKHKIYVDAITTDTEPKFKGGYLFHKGNDKQPERNLEQRYLRLQQQRILRQRQDQKNIQIAREWAKSKSKVNKQLQKKLQARTFQPKYSFCKEQEPTKQVLSYQQELKFGFTTAVRAKPKYAQVDFTSTHLPKINQRRQSLDQKSIRKDRLKSLKGKFGKMLNLSQYEDRQSAPSMCQFTTRKRNFSQILKQHSQSKQRLQQLEEVSKIKQRLTRNKIGINIKSLSMGLCLPQNQQQMDQNSIFPQKQLPSNPFFQVKKKKKK